MKKSERLHNEDKQMKEIKIPKTGRLLKNRK